MTDDLGSIATGAGQAKDPRPAWTMFQPAVLLGLLSGLAYGIVTRFLLEANRFGALFGIMTLSFLLLVPMVIGYLTVRSHPTPWADAIMRSIQANILEVIRKRAEAGSDQRRPHWTAR
jgi:membrane protein required for beta-lactamase induction